MLRYQLTRFCREQREKEWGTKTLEDVAWMANNVYDHLELQPGYDTFCRHLFIPAHAFPTITLKVAGIRPTNEVDLKTGYIRRRPDELPVLSRWFPAGAVEPIKARYLDLILYSREQIAKEGSETVEAPWGIITVNPELKQEETPILPMTQLRNALGTAEGGSGSPLNRDAYLKAVEFWDNHAIIRSQGETHD